jgi:hypothetical protein
MYSNESHGHHIRYRPPGQAVVRTYQDSVSTGRTADQTISAMQAEIVRQGPSRVSNHIADPSTLNVLDISPRSLQNPAAFIQQLQNDPRVQRVIAPPQDPAIHVEIRQPAPPTPDALP